MRKPTHESSTWGLHILWTSIHLRGLAFPPWIDIKKRLGKLKFPTFPVTQLVLSASADQLLVWPPCSQVHLMTFCVPMPPGGKKSSPGDLLGEALSPFDDGLISNVAFLGRQSIEQRVRAVRVAAIGLGWRIGVPPLHSGPRRYLCRSTSAAYHPDVLMLMAIANGAVPMSLWCILWYIRHSTDFDFLPFTSSPVISPMFR